MWSDQNNIMLPFLCIFYFLTTAEWGIFWEVTLILEILLKKAIWNISVLLVYKMLSKQITGSPIADDLEGKYLVLDMQSLETGKISV